MSDSPRTPPEQFHAACERIGLSLEPAELEQCGCFVERLLETNRRFNLTAIREPDEAWMRHILESLALLPFVADAGCVADVGSGGGLPGIPLAIVRPKMKLTLVESTGKKARFLEETASALGLDQVRVVNDRAESVGCDHAHRERYDLATARAVGPMRVLLELTLPLVRPHGRLLAVKGKKFRRELDEAGDALMHLGGGTVELYELLPGLDDEAVVVEITKAGRTPRQYPRRPGEPKRDPL